MNDLCLYRAPRDPDDPDQMPQLCSAPAEYKWWPNRNSVGSYVCATHAMLMIQHYQRAVRDAEKALAREKDVLDRLLGARKL